MKQLLKYGNAKINSNTGIFNLPTSVCVTKCKSCYAAKSEVRFPLALKSRNENYSFSLKPDFPSVIKDEIKKSKKIKYLRIHESGDFYSQEYITKWNEIISDNKDIGFYAYTKRMDDFNFSDMNNFPNMNLINSITPNGVNYGDQKYCNELITKHGYHQCDCTPGVKISCQLDCTVCSTKGNNKIVFLRH